MYYGIGKRPHRLGLVQALIAAAASLSLVSPTFGSEFTGRDITVHFADIEANTLDGATVLLRRIESAVQRVCAPLDHGDLSSRARRAACELKLTAAAVTQVNSSALATVYESMVPAAPRVIARVR